jgi:hypothetical protein
MGKEKAMLINLSFLPLAGLDYIGSLSFESIFFIDLDTHFLTLSETGFTGMKKRKIAAFMGRL